jgi:cobalt/nickel transport system permease protein
MSVLLSIIVSSRLTVVTGIYLSTVLLVRLAALPVLRMMGLAAYPAAFALFFALSQLSGGWQLPMLIILKAQTAALALLTLLGTTSYPTVFGLFSPLFPRFLTDALLLAYRLFFVLLDLVLRFLAALRLRGGLSSLRPSVNLRHVAFGLGALFVLSYEKSQRLYDLMNLRGYRGSIASTTPLSLRKGDWLPLLVGAWVLIVSLAVEIGS